MTHIAAVSVPVESMGTRTQDLTFTLYGDYIRYRGGTAWIGSLIKLLGTLGASEHAVRSTAGRMARNGWLRREKQGRHSYYSLTSKAVDLLREGSTHIFARPDTSWDGHWYLALYAFSGDHDAKRHELRRHLSWMGFGQLASGAWVSPRNRRDELCAVLDRLGAREYVDYFQASHLCAGEGASLAARCWDLDSLRRRYCAFIEEYTPILERARALGRNGRRLIDERAFRRRFWLVHEYRYFPFHDPYLPPELLPADWPGIEAVNLFQSYQKLLLDSANAYADQVLSEAPDLELVQGALA